MDQLVTGQGVELVEAGLDVVAEGLLAASDRGEIHPLGRLAVGGNGLLGYLQPQLALRLQHLDPQTPLEDDPSGGGPQLRHLGGGVARSEDVLDHSSTSMAAPRTPDESPWRFATSRVAASPPNT